MRTFWAVFLTVLLCGGAAYAEGMDGISGVAAESLTFGGVAFLTATVEACAEAFGEPHSDLLDGSFGGVRTMAYDGFSLEWTEARDGVWQLESVIVTGDTLPGPLGLAIEDSTQSVVERFGLGDEDERLMYIFLDASGREVCALACSFSEDSLTDYLLYRL